LTPAEWSILALVAGIVAGLTIGRVRTTRHGSPPDPTPPQAPVPPVPIESTFAPLVRALPLGVIIVNRACHVEFANAAAGATFGFDPERAIALHIIEVVPNVELERRIADALKGEGSVAPLMLTRARIARTYRVSVYPLTEENQESSRVVVFSDDQTALTRLDRARK
jgi:transcriptional regulator of aromatic amino acid metabolism